MQRVAIAGLAVFSAALVGHALGRAESMREMRRLTGALEVLDVRLARAAQVETLRDDLRRSFMLATQACADSTADAVDPLADAVGQIAERAHFYLPPADDIEVAR